MFFESGNELYAISKIIRVDLSRIQDLIVYAYYADASKVKLEGVDAINFLYRYHPSALEGKRLRWIKYGWMFHNLVGHPLMQILALFRFYKTAIKVHEATIPKPRGEK
jgi:hypothetical protein